MIRVIEQKIIMYAYYCEYNSYKINNCLNKIENYFLITQNKNLE